MIGIKNISFVEKLRSHTRRATPKFVYKQLSNVWNSVIVILSEGLKAWWCLCISKEPVSLNLKGLKYPINIGSNSAHRSAVIQNVIRKEYEAFTLTGQIRTIIDAGGFIGDFSVRMATRFPRARIIMLEPDPRNIEYARINCAPYKNAITVCSNGLWSGRKTLSLTGEGMGSNIGEYNQGNEVAAIGVSDLIRKFSLSQIDIFKIDIEGAEEELFLRGSVTWLRGVRQFLIEFHTQKGESAITAILYAAGFNSIRSRSIVYFYRD